MTKKFVLWILVGVSAFLFFAGFVVVRTEAFRHFLLGKIIAQAQASTGARIEIRSMDLHWDPLTVDFYGIVAHGNEQVSEAPLVTAEHLHVSLGIRALLHKKVDLFAIILDRPAVHVRMDPQGRTNLPEPATKSSSHYDVLVLHLAITNGVIRYNDEETPLSAELRDFRAKVDYDRGAAIYRGTIAYGRGWIVAKDFRPLEHTADVRFSANAQGMVLDRLAIATEKSRLAVHATLVDFSNPRVEGSYEGVVDTREFARVLNNPSLPSGDIGLQGTVTYRIEADEPFLRQVRVEGRLESKTLAVGAQQRAMALNAIRASYRLANGNLEVRKLEADLLGGHLSATAEMLHLDKNPSSRVTAAVRGVSLERIGSTVPAGMRQNIVLKGRVKAEIQAAWSGDIQNGKAHAHLEIYGPLSPAAQPNEIPVNANITMDYDGAHQSASFGHSEIRATKTNLTLSGVLSRNSKLDVQANVGDLHELSELAATVMAAAREPNAPAPTAYDIFGSAQFNGQVSGAIQDPRIQGELLASNLAVQGSKWRKIRANIDARSSGVRLQNLYAQTDQGGEISVNARTDLQHWSFTPQSPLSVQGKLSKLSLGELELLAKVDYPIAGTLSGQFTVTGTERQPKGDGSLQLANALAWSEPVNAFVLQFHGTDEAVDSTLHVRTPAGAANAKLTYFPKTQRYQAKMQASNVRLGQVRSLQQHKETAKGTLSLEVTGEGAIADPQFTAELDARELQVSGQKFSDVDARLNLAHQRAELQVTSGVAQASVQVKGGVDLKDDYPSNMTLDVRALPLGPLLAMYNPAAAQDLRGQTEIHGSLRGPLKNLHGVEATVEIPTLNVGYKTLQIGNDGPLRLTYRNGVAKIDQFKIKGSGTQFSVQGTIPVNGSAPMNASAKGSIDMALLQMISPDVRSSGHIDIDVQSRGVVSAPSTQGEIRIVNGSLAAEDLPVALSAINGNIAISGNRIDIKEVKGSAGGGTLAAYGSLTYGKQPNFALKAQAKSVRIHPNGLRAVLDGNVQLNGDPQKSMLSGQVLVDRLSFQDGFDLGTFLAQVSSEQQVSTPSPFESNMALKMSVQSTQNLSLASSQLSMEGSANLNVTGTAANPVILGRVNLTGGEVFFLSKRFEVQNGTIAFANPVQTEAVVNLYVKTVVRQYNITIHFSGPATQLKTSYTSEPALSELNIINLLAFGQTTAEQASNPSQPASVGAESAVAQQAAGQVAGKIQEATGISQLTIDPLAGASDNPGAQVAIQQRLTGSILMTFSTDVTSTQRQTVEIEYQPKKQWKYSVIRDEYGGYGFDVRYHKVF